MRGQARIRCEACGRVFGGQFTFDRHRTADGTCLQTEELHARGIRRNRRHVWVRLAPAIGTARQGRLFDARDVSLTRRMFGKPFRALSLEERRRYRTALQESRERSSSARDEPRNAIRASQRQQGAA